MQVTQSEATSGFTRASHSVFLCKSLGMLLLVAAIPVLPASGKAVEYSRHVLPILSANCFACHGPDPSSRQAELRLDEPENPIDLGVIVPGKPDESELIHRINSVDEDEIMPPPESHKVLTAEQIAILSEWIASGAKYERHWSFVVPQRPSVPAIGRPNWAKSPVDQFILARLQDEMLEPSEAASRATLIRRVSLDLTGLPPSGAEVEAFVSNNDPQAYEALVDRLLASPHFGERMAQSWLDAARYADTNGYSIDGGREMWIWRDWVIDAFNKNKPYDQFLVEQLAGDLLPDASESQLIATGFQRNNMVTHEGGTIPEENLVNYNADRVKTLGEAILGLTLGCAQCHDHKFDPIKQSEYYSLFAYFNTASDVGLDGNGGVSPRPTIRVRTVLQSGDIEAIRQEIAAAEAQLEHPDEAGVTAWERAQVAALERRGRVLELHAVKLLAINTPNSGDGFEIEDNAAHISRGPGLAAYDVLFKVPPTAKPVTGYRIEFLPETNESSEDLGFGTLPSSERKTFVLTAVSLSTGQTASRQISLNRLAPISRATASSWLAGYRPENALDMRRQNGWSPDINREQHSHVTLTLAEPMDVVENPFVTMQVNFGSGGALVAKRFKFYAMTGEDDGTALPDDVVEILLIHARRMLPV